MSQRIHLFQERIPAVGEELRELEDEGAQHLYPTPLLLRQV